MTIRERTEQLERDTLSPYACLSAETRGRETPLSYDGIRTEFQRDRDRILHCKAFRRLMHKTQVFLSPEGDHYRTRLTHTLEVAQIARTMAVALRLNENLTEAIALGHDLGHTPFGHAGERALNEVAPEGFRHYEQSVRVVERLERDGAGLDLTWEVRDGIGAHTNGQAGTLEGRLVRLADHFAYAHHDLEDAIRAGVLSEEDVPAAIREELGADRGTRLTALINSVIETSADDIRMDERTAEIFADLETFMYDAVYINPIAKSQEHKAMAMLKQLYAFFLENPNRLPAEYLAIAFSEGADRAICDYISGMSDRYAIKLYTDYFIPKGWSKE
ncbi:MAG TPA: deoxyguanosinetriphosphate triphosphohydrolase [Oscillospiraceae bacterium]|nr:deoxyguanosinetriphosphate triphosphohydrolase [Oscillospiraceae bacterium]HNW04789.1 deoxyguanosinetriphosphate triphosphohydrolase [Oscillospiraceae bacterium]HPV99770.1 deoxyguanosinetriphosphate triphosphohydrolase [Oscillospiraceae bacterium]